ncbi:zf-HC2 domain-containing protein [Microlunatus capsulatus]|uniref:Anti-sigma factor RsiW n=1 Tax=Microlunatus capsulatus TaxID=99117 RepID=A0ABS4Z7Z1_9ACTN|nr:zf-HC2 domain-containing protein [Microlunatus capsulatus]MBP2417089.1 anti-sigma factor RsiW [Microlunatus capsulatus]
MTTPEPTGGDRYADWDAAYVLGALAPAERAEFEAHLAGCARCRSAVSEIAGLPGLLSQVGPEDAARLTDPAPAATPPETLLPAVLATARRQRRQLRTRLLAVAAGLVLVLGGFLLGQRGGADPVSRWVAFEPQEATGITAVVELVPVADGTEVSVQCQDASGAEAGSHLAVVVADRAGGRGTVKDWEVKAGKVNRPSGHTRLTVAEIAAVEIRDVGTGDLVLRAPVG